MARILPGVAEDPPFTDVSFDTTAGTFTLCFIRAPARALQ